MVGNRQSVTGLEFEDFVNLAGIDQAVTAHHVFILIDGRRYVIKMVDFNKVSAFYVEESCFTERLADIRVIRGDQQLYRIVRRRSECLLRSLAFRQPSAHKNDDSQPHNQGYHAGNKGREHIHGMAARLFVEFGDNDIRRGPDKRTHAAHHYGINHGEIQFRCGHVQFPGPLFHEVAE